MLNFVNTDFTIEAGEGSKRTITGVAVPYGVEATVTSGQRVIIEAGALPTDGKNPKLFMNHDSTKAIGTVINRVEASDGSAMLFTAKVAGTNLGNEALILASENVLDSVSIGITPTKWTTTSDGVMKVQAAVWGELSLVPTPAFSGATISTVTASAETSPDTNSETTEPIEEISEVEETPVETAVVEASAPQSVIATPLFASAPKAARLPSASEYLAAYHIGGTVKAGVERQILDWKNQNQNSIEAAAGDETLTNMPLLSNVVLGPVFQELAFISPVTNALGRRAMPNSAGNTFIRPTISQHTTVAAQSAELAAVSTQSMVTVANTVTKSTIGGSLDISYQAIDFTDPNALTVVLNDLAGEYILAEEAITCTNLLAAATSSGVWDLTAADFMKSLYDAAVDISTTTNRMPTHIMVSPDVWAQIGQLVDSSNRPLFAYTGGTGLQGYNALGNSNVGTWTGVNPLGLELVVSSKLAAKSMIILNNTAFECYSQMRGMLSVEQPSTLSRLISIFGYYATFRANATMIRKITQA